ncbi:MAG: hypothetical protein M3024_12675 [Candidatus Dormibacteraeota bacterium]|nr:hypothetical protein [Candidatus Dormibacteraeota bacterium]
MAEAEGRSQAEIVRAAIAAYDARGSRIESSRWPEPGAERAGDLIVPAPVSAEVECGVIAGPLAGGAFALLPADSDPN